MENFTSGMETMNTVGASSTTAKDIFDVEDDDGCSICLESFSSDDPATVTSCKHEYHLQCILEWSQRRTECPICWQLLVLKEPSSQELLAAVEVERNSRSRLRMPNSSMFSRTRPDYFDFEPVSYAVESDFDEHIMQQLTALGRAHHYNRRQRHRSYGLDPSQFLVLSASSNDSNLQETYTNMPVENQSAVHPSSPESDYDRDVESTRAIHNQLAPHELTACVDTTLNVPDNPQAPLRPRLLSSQTLPRSPWRSRPSESPSFSETLKSKFSAASARYKESITKSTRSIKEKLLARNNSVKELSKEVQREVTAGIAGVARMMERLDPTSKNVGSSSPVSSGTEGSSNVSNNGKGVQQNLKVASPDGIHLENAHGTSSKSHNPPRTSLSYVPRRVEVAHMQDGR